MRGEWTPGQRLPPLSELAAHFRISRTVIRESCSMLVGSGLLELRHGDGTYVREFNEEAIRRPLHAAVLMASSDARALLETGLWLERGTAEAAAGKRTDADLANLAAALFALEEGGGGLDAFLRGEEQFHIALADASGNQAAANLLRVLYQPLAGVLRWLAQDEALLRLAVPLHRALYDSVAKMDAAAAERQLSLYRTLLLDRVSALRRAPLPEKGGSA